MKILAALSLVTAFGVSDAIAAPKKFDSPAAASRRDASNFKDMVLAICISKSYVNQTSASADAASTARALIEWTMYDAENAPGEIERLVGRYLKRNYRNPIGDVANGESRFDLLKCLDLYHSAELEALTRRILIARPAHP